MTVVIALIAVGLLAFANGANDNFKGVATLFGGGVSDYRKAIIWATVATLAGSVAAIALTGGLVATFSGTKFVSPSTLALTGFPLAVTAASAATVLLATRFGFPISTTHALIGALLGAAVAAPGSRVEWGTAGSQVFPATRRRADRFDHRRPRDLPGGETCSTTGATIARAGQ